MSRLALVLALLLATSPSHAQHDRTTPDPEPTAEETLALELVNRFRADPRAEAQRVSTPPFPRKPYPELDLDMLRREVSALEPAPPLVFQPRLILASRNHSDYQTRNERYGHQEEAGRPGFSGPWPQDRVKYVGYGKKAAECTVAHTESVWCCHWGMIVDDGPGGGGGMQPGRGHRTTTISRRWREFGAGFSRHRGGKIAGTWLLGAGDGRRRAGGVCFIDRNGNRFYDVGEGVGGVRLGVDGRDDVTSWSAGAWVGDVSAKAGRVIARYRGLVVERSFGAGDDNVKVDFELGGVLLARLRPLAKRAGGKGTAAFRAAVDFAELAPVAPGLSRHVEAPALVETVRVDLEADRETTLARASSEEKTASREIRKAAVKYRNTLASPWFETVVKGLEFRRRLARLERRAARAPLAERERTKALDEVGALRERVFEERLGAWLDGMRNRTLELRIVRKGK